MNELNAEQKKALIDAGVIIGAIILLTLLHAHGDGWEILFVSLFLPCYFGYAVNSWLRIINNRFVRPHFPFPNEAIPAVAGIILIIIICGNIIQVPKGLAVITVYVGMAMWCWGWFLSLKICKNFLWGLGVFAAALISTHHLWIDIVQPMGIGTQRLILTF